MSTKVARTRRLNAILYAHASRQQRRESPDLGVQRMRKAIRKPKYPFVVRGEDYRRSGPRSAG